MRILGIDLGSSSIKAVEMDSAFGRFEIHDYHETPVEVGVEREETALKLIKSLAKNPDRIIISLSSSLSTFRNLQLPTRDKKAIQSGVAFELEDELPFSLEDSVFDYSILSQAKTASTVHVAATLKSHMVQTLQPWSSSEQSPDVVTTEGWGYRTLLNRVLGPTHQELPVLLIQMGHERTTFYLHWKGAPTLIRDIDWGGSHLTEALTKKYNLPAEQAESLKIDQGFIYQPEVGQEVTAEQIELSHCLESALEPLLAELRQITLMSRSTTHHSIHLIYIAGGTSLLPGLGPWIESKVKVQTQPLLGLSSITSSGVTYSHQTDARFLFAASLTLSLVGSDRATCINFRKGEFLKEGKTREFNFEALKKPLLAVGIVSFCLFLSLIVQSRVYKSRLATTDVLLEKSVRTFFGQLSNSALRTYMSNTSTLRASIHKELTKQRELSKLFGPNPHSPLDFLNGLSSAVPKDVILDLTQFQAGTPPNDPFATGDQTVSTNLTFLISNPQMAEKLSSVLNSKLTHFQRGKMEETAANLPESALKKWKISFSGNPTEDSYGR